MKKTNIVPMKKIPTVEMAAEFSPIGDCYFLAFSIEGMSTIATQLLRFPMMKLRFILPKFYNW